MTENPIIDKLISERVKNFSYKSIHDFRLNSTTKYYYEMIQVVAHQFALLQIEKDRDKIKKSMSELFFDKDLEYLMEKIKIELE